MRSCCCGFTWFKSFDICAATVLRVTNRQGYPRSCLHTAADLLFGFSFSLLLLTISTTHTYRYIHNRASDELIKFVFTQINICLVTQINICLVTHCLGNTAPDQSHDGFTLVCFSVWLCVESSVAVLFSVCATAALGTAVWILMAAYSALPSHVVTALSYLLPFPLCFPAPNNHYGNVPGRRLKATHERWWGVGKCEGWVRGEQLTYKLAWNFTARSIWCHFCEQAATWDARMRLGG